LSVAQSLVNSEKLYRMYFPYDSNWAHLGILNILHIQPGDYRELRDDFNSYRKTIYVNYPITCVKIYEDKNFFEKILNIPFGTTSLILTEILFAVKLLLFPCFTQTKESHLLIRLINDIVYQLDRTPFTNRPIIDIQNLAEGLIGVAVFQVYQNHDITTSTWDYLNQADQLYQYLISIKPDIRKTSHYDLLIKYKTYLFPDPIKLQEAYDWVRSNECRAKDYVLFLMIVTKLYPTFILFCQVGSSNFPLELIIPTEDYRYLLKYCDEFLKNTSRLMESAVPILRYWILLDLNCIFAAIQEYVLSTIRLKSANPYEELLAYHIVLWVTIQLYGLCIFNSTYKNKLPILKEHINFLMFRLYNIEIGVWSYYLNKFNFHLMTYLEKKDHWGSYLLNIKSE